MEIVSMRVDAENNVCVWMDGIALIISMNCMYYEVHVDLSISSAKNSKQEFKIRQTHSSSPPYALLLLQPRNLKPDLRELPSSLPHHLVLDVHRAL